MTNSEVPVEAEKSAEKRDLAIYYFHSLVWCFYTDGGISVALILLLLLLLLYKEEQKKEMMIPVFSLVLPTFAHSSQK